MVVSDFCYSFLRSEMEGSDEGTRALPEILCCCVEPLEVKELPPRLEMKSLNHA